MQFACTVLDAFLFILECYSNSVRVVKHSTDVTMTTTVTSSVCVTAIVSCHTEVSVIHVWRCLHMSLKLLRFVRVQNIYKIQICHLRRWMIKMGLVWNFQFLVIDSYCAVQHQQISMDAWDGIVSVSNWICIKDRLCESLIHSSGEALSWTW